ncbi:MAG: glycerol-3-phosphate 1-O-acyltransferase PlsY [Lactobacillaceae bacterium]|jgi:glycerol-3-phosphate acyltransferase PlsY|nr:glycerol-3-phosphate 1-O-acyltransferase PlsY [Lactobacillaceae bacterium]
MIISFITWAIIAYLLGSLMPGFWIGKLIYKKDIRTSGSGNIGTTNAFRTLGVVPGTITMLLDIFKGFLAVYLPMTFAGSLNNYVLYIGLFAVVGHVYSIFLKFHGGKAVATSFGVIFAFNPSFAGLLIISIVSLIFLTSMVSVASMGTFTFGTIMAIFYYKESQLIVFALISTAVAFYAHRKNFKRIITNTETMVPFGIKYWLSKK